MATRFNPSNHAYILNGAALAGGKLRFKATGSDTLKNTYSDSALTTPNTNPVLLDADGIPDSDIWLDGTYKVELLNSSDVEQWELDPVGTDSAGSPWTDWVSTQSYAIGDIAQGSDGAYYMSITSSNTGNDPTSSATNWTQVDVTKIWNTNESYSEDDVVTGSDGRRYRSLANSNQGNSPLTDQTKWNVVSASVKVGSFTVTNTSATAVTGVGFKPSRIDITAMVSSGTVASQSNGTSDGTTDVCAYFHADSSARGAGSSAHLWRVSGSAGGIENRGALTSLDSDGFTVTADTAASTATLIYRAYP